MSLRLVLGLCGALAVGFAMPWAYSAVSGKQSSEFRPVELELEVPTVGVLRLHVPIVVEGLGGKHVTDIRTSCECSTSQDRVEFDAAGRAEIEVTLQAGAVDEGRHLHISGRLPMSNSRVTLVRLACTPREELNARAVAYVREGGDGRVLVTCTVKARHGLPWSIADLGRLAVESEAGVAAEVQGVFPGEGSETRVREFQFDVEFAAGSSARDLPESLLIWVPESESRQVGVRCSLGRR